MEDAQPMFDVATHYRLEVQGRVDIQWLQRFDGSAGQTTVHGAEQGGAITVLDVHTDQSGIVGLVRKLHGLGVTILQLQIVRDGRSRCLQNKGGNTP